MNPDPEASGLVHLTRLHSIVAKQTDDCFSIDEQSCRTNSIRNNSVSITNQSSLNNQPSLNNQSFKNASLETVSVSSSNYQVNFNQTNIQQSRQSNHNIIQHLHLHSNAPKNRLNSHSSNHSFDNQLEPERSYRSKSFAKRPTRTRLQSFSVIEKQDLYRQNEISTNLEESNRWSFKHLKNEFKANNFEKLFDKYKIRIQHNFFVLMLMLNIGFNLIALTLYYYYDRPHSVHYGVAVIRLFCMIFNILMLILTFNSELYLLSTRSRIFCSMLVLILLFISEYSPSIYALLHPPSALLLQRIRPTYFLILINHVFLPHPNYRYAFFCTGFLVSFEISLTIYSRFVTECYSVSIVWYTLADLIFHVTCSLIGHFINTMLEAANRRAFLVYRSVIEGKFHLNNQLKQQDDLLNTCIPKHLSERVKQDLKQALFEFSINRNLPCKPFNELYIEKYSKVTILYADIVNSMALAANLSAHELVCTLNELYRRFDQVTEFNKCLRIKLLGDCYYCVSGCEIDKEGNHAENSVNTGLSMLDIIKDVRAKSKVEVDMRIGLHTGMIMSGLMGLYKWQYDIWSLDSMKASEQEHTGVAGFLHLTNETLSSLSYQFRNKLVIKERFDLDQTKTTYLIKKKYEEDHSLIARLQSTSQKDCIQSNYTTIKKGFDPTILIESILKYREMVNFVNTILEDAIDEMPLTKKEQWFHSKGINPILLTFRTSLSKTLNLSFFEMEKKFALQLDPLFRYYLYCAALICLSITLIKYCVPEMRLPFKLIVSLFSAIGIIIFFLVVIQYYKQKLHLVFRIAIWLIVSCVLVCCATVDLILDECQLPNLDNPDLMNCAFTWYYTYSMVLAMTSVSIFIRINYYLKLTLYIIFFSIFFKMIYATNSMVNLVDKDVKWKFYGHLPQVGHVYYVIIVTLLLHILDRQIEYILRLDFQWASKLENERKEAIHLGKINRLLLLNILPEHIVARYMCDQIWIAPEVPYSETYKSVCVMFASIPNYAETYAENEMNGHGLKCLQILNEIIHDFDKIILFNEEFSEVEKIKTIGSTFMASTGLRSKKDSFSDSLSVDEDEHHRAVVITMVNFAIEMLKKLQRFNKDALQELKLRIGISVGPVVAGVVGASKPQYDIWGDTVNTASRMDSFGKQGRIHITEQVAEVLKDKPEYHLECRGEIEVKGKGKLITYLLRTPYDDDDVIVRDRESTVI